MKRSLFVIATCFLLSACGDVKSGAPRNEAALAVIASPSCFHGWVSRENNVEPTGFCGEDRPGGLESSIEVDFPTQRLYIHGSIDGKKLTWFRFEATSCQDIGDGWTVVTGVNSSTGEKYELRQREIKEIPPTGQAKQAFQGEAKLSVGLNGQSYQADLSCVRYVF